MRRVLLVDDEPHVSRVMKIALDRRGYEVEMARNGEEALARQRSEPFDVIITDYQMPKMDGRGLCEALAADAPEPAPLTLLVTGKTDPQLRGQAPCACSSLMSAISRRAFNRSLDVARH